ncbi:MAG: histidine phosphatase family protein [Betaproteobacteria bacterium]|nr:histidine phosphatase family protein [Betaproteobacteria bacterium]
MPDTAGIAILSRPLYFLRHGETENNRLSLIAGSADVELNAAGWEQARAAAEMFEDTGITAVYTSALRRARDTAEIVAQALRMPVVVVPELAERNWGALEGKPRALRVRGVTPPGAETPEAFLERTRRGLARIDAAGMPLLVAHSGTFRVLCRLTSHDEPSLPVPNCRPVRFTPPSTADPRWRVDVL